MKTLKIALQNKKAKLAAAGAAVVSSVAATSAHADSTTAITDAIADGQALVGLVAPGVIAIAAIMLGVGLVVSWLRK